MIPENINYGDATITITHHYNLINIPARRTEHLILIA